METFRHGYYATYGDAAYHASPAPDGTVRLYAAEPVPGFEQLPDGRHRRVVPRAEVDEVRHVRTVATHSGVPVVLIGSHGRWLRAECVGEDPAAADRLGFEQFEPGVYQGWIERDAVADVREVID